MLNRSDPKFSMIIPFFFFFFRKGQFNLYLCNLLIWSSSQIASKVVKANDFRAWTTAEVLTMQYLYDSSKAPFSLMSCQYV